MPERQHATWGELLREAVEKPGRMLEAYIIVDAVALSVEGSMLADRAAELLAVLPKRKSR
jgi:hypothetical protein